MSPQPKQVQQDAPTTPAPDNGTPEAPADFGPFIAGLLEQAKALHTEKSALFVRIGANRDMLRNLQKSDSTTPEQDAEINKVYPLRERKPKGDAPATADTPKS